MRKFKIGIVLGLKVWVALTIAISGEQALKSARRAGTCLSVPLAEGTIRTRKKPAPARFACSKWISEKSTGAKIDGSENQPERKSTLGNMRGEHETR